MARRWQVGLVISYFIAVAGGNPAVAGTSPRRAERDLQRACDRWIVELNTGHYHLSLQMMTQDAAILSAAGPIVQGQAALKSYVSKLTAKPGFHLEYSSEVVSVDPSGRIGTIVGPSRITSDRGQGLQTQAYRLLTVWRRDSNRPWRVYLDVPIPAPQPTP